MKTITYKGELYAICGECTKRLARNRSTDSEDPTDVAYFCYTCSFPMGMDSFGDPSEDILICEHCKDDVAVGRWVDDEGVIDTLCFGCAWKFYAELENDGMVMPRPLPLEDAGTKGGGE